MKQALNYSLKVTLTTLLLCLPITICIMMACVKISAIITSNYMINLHLNLIDAAIFIALTFCALLFNMREINGETQVIYNKRNIARNSMLESVALFLVYLLLSGKLMSLSIDEFLITYGPTFLITMISMRSYSLRNEESQTKLI